MNALGTLSILELLWIGITLIGLVVSAANSLDSLDSAEVASKIQIREPGDAVLKQIKVAIAAEHVRAEAVYLAIHGLFFVIGFIAALTPAEPRMDNVEMSAVLLLVTVVVPIVFFSVQIAMILNSLQVRKTRRYIIGLRALASLSTESKGTFAYKDTVGQPGEGTGAFSMKTEATRNVTNSRKDDPPAPVEAPQKSESLSDDPPAPIPEDAL